MKKVDVEKLDFKKGGGLVPIVVQHWKTRDVLMLAYANKEAVLKTLETGYAHFWSRSRNRLWMKGESSGNYLKIKRILVDCDEDTILYLVEPRGPVCHTGNYSCFYRELKS